MKKWYRVLFAVMAFGLVTCSNPTAPRLPDADDEEPADPKDPGPNQGYYVPPDVEIVFFA